MEAKKMKNIEEMDIRHDILVYGVKTKERYLTDALFFGGNLQKLFGTYDFLTEENFRDFMKMCDDTGLPGMIFVPYGRYDRAVPTLAKYSESDIELYRTGFEGKSC